MGIEATALPRRRMQLETAAKGLQPLVHVAQAEATGIVAHAVGQQPPGVEAMAVIFDM